MYQIVGRVPSRPSRGRKGPKERIWHIIGESENPGVSGFANSLCLKDSWPRKERDQLFTYWRGVQDVAVSTSVFSGSKSLWAPSVQKYPGPTKRCLGLDGTRWIAEKQAKARCGASAWRKMERGKQGCARGQGALLSTMQRCTRNGISRERQKILFVVGGFV